MHILFKIRIIHHSIYRFSIFACMSTLSPQTQNQAVGVGQKNLEASKIKPRRQQVQQSHRTHISETNASHNFIKSGKPTWFLTKLAFTHADMLTINYTNLSAFYKKSFLPCTLGANQTAHGAKFPLLCTFTLHLHCACNFSNNRYHV